MTDEEIEKKAKEYAKGNFYSEQGFLYGYEIGLAEGKKEIKKQWHDCFLSCSSPYCAKQFPEVKMEGELGNMTKG